MRHDIGAAELGRPGDQRAVARDLVVLHRLRGGDEAGIHHVLVVDLADQILAFLQDAVDRRALLALRIGVHQLEHLAQPVHLAFRFGQMLLEARAQLRVRRLLDHVGQRLHDLVLGVIEVLQPVHEQVVEVLDVLAEESHGAALVVLESECGFNGKARQEFRPGRGERQPSALRARVIVVQEFGELLAQAFVALAAMADHQRMLEQLLLDLGRQLRPHMDGGGAHDRRKARFAGLVVRHPVPSAMENASRASRFPKARRHRRGK